MDAGARVEWTVGAGAGWRRSPSGVQVVAGARDVVAICPGMVLLGVTFGLVVVQAGLEWWWAPAFSGLIFGGSLEFLLIAMVTSGASLAAVAVTSLLVQGRHVFYALSFPLQLVQGRLRRAYAVFALTDEAYALTATRPHVRHTGTRILTLQVLMHASWVAGGIIGAVAGSALTLRLAALDFVFTALFVVLATDATLAGRRIADPMLAVACALIARLVAPGQMLLVGMALYGGLLVVLRPLLDVVRTAQPPSDPLAVTTGADCA